MFSACIDSLSLWTVSICLLTAMFWASPLAFLCWALISSLRYSSPACFINVNLQWSTSKPTKFRQLFWVIRDVLEIAPSVSPPRLGTFIIHSILVSVLAEIRDELLDFSSLGLMELFLAVPRQIFIGTFVSWEFPEWFDEYWLLSLGEVDL